MTEFDLIVIGSGPGGYRAAVLGALRGLRVAIVEKAEWGGCCLNRGCVPKKAWYHTAHLLAASQRFSERGITGSLRADLGVAWDHQRMVVQKVRESYLDYMKRLGITRHEGLATFSDSRHVTVSGASGKTAISGAHCIIATGANPYVPEPLRGISERVLTTDDLFDRPPPSGARVAIIGGGVIATEFAFILKLLGKDVTWISRRTPLARTRFGPEARSSLARALSGYGVVPTELLIEGASAQGAQVLLQCSGDARPAPFDWVLVATGRRPVTNDLNLAAAGVSLSEDGFVAVDETLATASPGTYAIGDCIGGPMTATQALHDAGVAIANVLGGEGRWQRAPHRVPEVIYSALEMARIGLDDDEADDAELDAAVGFSAFGTSPEALGQDQAEGFVRILGDMDSGRFLGGEIVGREAGELIHLLSFLADGGMLATVAETSFNHPARAEELLNAVETMASKWNLSDVIFRH
ncbi:MAG: dihydrolipoyl dehydrogenase family protein [Acidiferrobacteraceae bacterium]